MTKAELEAKGAIFFEQITEGFQEFKDETLTFSKEEALKYFREKIERYGNEKSFADFYYFSLNRQAQGMVKTKLSEEEMTYLEQIRPEGDAKEQLIFPLTDELLKIIVKLNADEMLFSTLYFLEANGLGRMMFWGNFGGEYICFSDSK